jgi:predicted metal-dependent hydrolase
MKWKTVSAVVAEVAERQKLHRRIAGLIAKWEPILGVHVKNWDLRKMKTFWGSTNKELGHTTFNTEIAKLPAKTQEYLVVHELAHHLTNGHDAKFYAIMDRNVPGWRKIQARIEEPLTQFS